MRGANRIDRSLSCRLRQNGHMGVELFDRKIYSESDAAEILRVPTSTLHWWLEGGERRGKTYPPVLRPESTGARSLTWSEFIEAALLRQYRRTHGVDLHEIRQFISRLREEQGVPYPLAHFVPMVGERRRLLLEIQQETNLPGELWLVAPTDDQIVLTEPAASFVRRVEWDDGLAVGWRPHDDDASPVRCYPDARFGRPSIGGISTEAIVEHLDGGEDETDVAEQFDLTVDDVRWASAYELSRRSALAA